MSCTSSLSPDSDSLRDVLKNLSQIEDNCESAGCEQRALTDNLESREDRASANRLQTRSPCDIGMPSCDSKIQGHASLLQEYSELCERAGSERRMSPLAWILRSKSQGAEALDLSHGESFLSSKKRSVNISSRKKEWHKSWSSWSGSRTHVPSIVPSLGPHQDPTAFTQVTDGSVGLERSLLSINLNSQLKPRGEGHRSHSRDWTVQHILSCPDLGALCASSEQQGGAAAGREDESAVYRKQVASALQDGRKVWL